jgi:primosomal protein N' (replication factor Y)
MTPDASGLKREASSVKRFCNVAIPHTRLGELTYEFDPALMPLGPGDCVAVRLRGKKAKAVVLGLATKSPARRTLPVEKLVEPALVSQKLLELLTWVGAYYFGRMGKVLGLALPRGVCGYGVRKSRQRPPDTGIEAVREGTQPAGGFSVGVSTDPGQIQEQVVWFVQAGLERGSVILLAPEPQLDRWSSVLRDRLSREPVLYHGEVRASERKRLWRELRNSEHRLVIGVRAAVFAPVPDLGGIVVADEHDKVFKEERYPRFHARDCAVVRARLCGCPVLLADATPSLETWLNLKNGAFEEIEGSRGQGSGGSSVGPPRTPEPTNPGTPVPLVVDMRRHRNDVISPLLANELRETLAAGRSAVLYINRLGLSRYVVCKACGTPLSCPDCGVPMVLFSGGKMVCRYCGKTIAAPDVCPCCQSSEFRFRAPGIELATAEVKNLVPAATVINIVTAVPSPKSLVPGPKSPAPGPKSCVVLGTRALFSARWPEDTGLVAAVSADDDLCLPDFRAAERTFQTMSSLVRQARDTASNLVIQTRRPDDEAIRSALDGNVTGFLDRELEARKSLEFPPHRRLALIEVQGSAGADAEKHALAICRRLGRVQGVEVLGPAPVSGRKNAVQLLVKLRRDLRLDRLLGIRELEPRGIRTLVDVDPVET